MPIIPVAEWLPDRPALSGGTTVASGVVWASSDAYGPLPGPALSVPMGLPGGGPPLGAIDVATFVGQHVLVCGTATRLCQTVIPPVRWLDVTGPGVVGGNMSWRFAQFKNTVLAASLQSPLQSIPLSGGVSTTIANAPSAYHICVTENFTVLGFTSDHTYGSGLTPYRIWWSGYNDPANWPAPGSTLAKAYQSDFNDFDGSLGVVTGLCSSVLNADMLVFFEFGIWSGSYVGGAVIFRFSHVAAARGTVWSSSIIVVDGIAYYYGENGFYGCDGMNVDPIGLDKVDQFVRANWGVFTAGADGLNTIKCSAAYDQRTRSICWTFTNHTAPYSSYMVIYHKEFRRWSYYSQPVFYSIIFTGAHALFLNGLYVERILCSLDYDGNYTAWTDKPVAAEFTTKEIEPIPGARCFVRGARLVGDVATATIATAARLSLAQPQAFGSDVAVNVAGDFPQRVEGRYVQGHIKIPAGATWSRVEGIEPSMIPSGSR